MKRLIILMVLVVLVALWVAPVLLAQDAAEAPALAAPAVSDELHAIADNLLGRLQDFIASSAALIGFAVYLATQFGKGIIPAKYLTSEQLYGIMVAIFSGVFILANLGDWVSTLNTGVALGNVLVEPLLTLLGMILVPQAAYHTFKKQNIPLFGAKQGTNSGWLTYQQPVG